MCCPPCHADGALTLHAWARDAGGVLDDDAAPDPGGARRVRRHVPARPATRVRAPARPAMRVRAPVRPIARTRCTHGRFSAGASRHSLPPRSLPPRTEPCGSLPSCACASRLLMLRPALTAAPPRRHFHALFSLRQRCRMPTANPSGPMSPWVPAPASARTSAPANMHTCRHGGCACIHADVHTCTYMHRLYIHILQEGYGYIACHMLLGADTAHTRQVLQYCSIVGIASTHAAQVTMRVVL